MIRLLLCLLLLANSVEAAQQLVSTTVAPNAATGNDPKTGLPYNPAVVEFADFYQTWLNNQPKINANFTENYGSIGTITTSLAGKANASGVAVQIADFSGLQKCTDTNWTTCVDLISSSPTDDNSQVWPIAAVKSYTSAAISSALGGISGGGAAAWTKVSVDPTVLSANGTYLNLTDGGLWYKDADTLCEVGSACLPIYDISLTITDTIPTNDTFTINSVAYDVNDSVAVIPTLSNASVGLHYDGAHTASCTGTGVSGASPSWTINAIADRSVNCTITATSSTFLHDTFTDSTNMLLTAHSPETGGAWTTRDSEDLTLSASTDLIHKVAETSSEFAINNTGTTYQNMSVTVKGVTNYTSSTRQFGALGRCSSDFQNGYYAVVSGDGYVMIKRILSGVVTTITSVTAIPSYSNTMEYSLTLNVSGTTIGYILKDNTSTTVASDSVTDSSVTAAGYAGVEVAHITPTITEITASSL